VPSSDEVTDPSRRPCPFPCTIAILDVAPLSLVPAPALAPAVDADAAAAKAPAEAEGFTLTPTPVPPLLLLETPASTVAEPLLTPRITPSRCRCPSCCCCCCCCRRCCCGRLSPLVNPEDVFRTDPKAETELEERDAAAILTVGREDGSGR